VLENAKRRVKKERSKYGPNYRRRYVGPNPDKIPIKVIKRKCRFTPPEIDQVRAILRERERKKETLLRKNESAQGSLERSPYVNPDLGRRSNRKRKYRPEMEEMGNRKGRPNHKRKGRPEMVETNWIWKRR
jgi:hypothetical protein